MYLSSREFSLFANLYLVEIIIFNKELIIILLLREYIVVEK